MNQRSAGRKSGARSIDDYREIHTLCEIGDSFKRYGLHPHCAGCIERCRQYNAPGSIITTCPRTTGAAQ